MNAKLPSLPTAAMFEVPACSVMDVLKKVAQINGDFFHIECDPRFPKPWRIRFKIRSYHTIEAADFAELISFVMDAMAHHNRVLTLESEWQPEAEYSI